MSCTFRLNILQMVTDGADINIPLNIISHVGFRLAHLELTQIYFKGHLVSGNGVLPYILTLLGSVLHPILPKAVTE